MRLFSVLPFLWASAMQSQTHVSNGEYLNYQPARGGIWRIETTYLNQAFYNSSLATVTVLRGLTQPWSLTATCGGTAMHSDGSVSLSDIDRWSIDKVFSNGTRITYLTDDRLDFVNTMWVNRNEKLWMPGASSSTTGVYPIYTIDIGFGPSPIDHA